MYVLYGSLKLDTVFTRLKCWAERCNHILRSPYALFKGQCCWHWQKGVEIWGFVNSWLFCGAFLSGSSHLISAFLVRGTISKYAELSLYGCSYTCVLSQEGFCSCPHHEIFTVSQSCVDSGPWGFWMHAKVVTKEPSGRWERERRMHIGCPFLRGLSDANPNQCSSDFQRSFSTFYRFLFFFARRYLLAMIAISQFSLCCG